MRIYSAAAAASLLLGTTARAQQVVWYHDGDNLGDSYGLIVTPVSDRDGDGVEDLFVGAPGTNCNGPVFGSAPVLSGTAGAELFRFCGTATNELFGGDLCEIPDIDGDGILDLVVGCPHHGDVDAGHEAGAAYIYSGGTQSLIYELIGESRSVQFGESCASIADVDGDGVDDLLIGEPEYAESGPPSRGRAFVYSAKTGTLLRRYEGANDYDRFGQIVARLGDIDADGMDDYAIQALATPAASRGAVYVFSALSGEQIFVWKGDHDFAGLGRSIANAGDLNDDGYDDVLLGAPGGPPSGFLYGYSGKDGKVLFKLRGDRNRDFFGVACSMVGDMNGDGYQEILVGADVDKHDGTNAGAAFLFSGKTRRVLYRFYPGYFQAVFGFQVVGGFDMNADGIPDVAISAINAPPDSDGNYYGGRVTAFAGNDLFLQSDLTDVSPGDTVNIASRGGPEGSLALLAVVDVSGSPVFVTLACTTLDANGESTFTADVPDEAGGNTYTLMAYCQPLGTKVVIDSGAEMIVVQ